MLNKVVKVLSGGLIGLLIGLLFMPLIPKTIQLKINFNLPSLADSNDISNTLNNKFNREKSTYGLDLRGNCVLIQSVDSNQDLSFRYLLIGANMHSLTIVLPRSANTEQCANFATEIISTIIRKSLKPKLDLVEMEINASNNTLFKLNHFIKLSDQSINNDLVKAILLPSMLDQEKILRESSLQKKRILSAAVIVPKLEVERDFAYSIRLMLLTTAITCGMLASLLFNYTSTLEKIRSRLTKYSLVR